MAAIKFHFIPCPGEAHNPKVGGMIDHCMLCAPSWGEILVPETCATIREWRDQYETLTAAQKTQYKSAETRFRNKAAKEKWQKDRAEREAVLDRECPGWRDEEKAKS